MNHARSFEVPHIGPDSLRNLRAETTFPDAVKQHIRKVGLALSLLLGSVGLTGCHSSQQTPEIASHVSNSSYGRNPAGFSADPEDPNKGSITVGGATVRVRRGTNGWEAEKMDTEHKRYMDEFAAKLRQMETDEGVDCLIKIHTTRSMLINMNNIHKERTNTDLVYLSELEKSVLKTSRERVLTEADVDTLQRVCDALLSPMELSETEAPGNTTIFSPRELMEFLDLHHLTFEDWKRAFGEPGLPPGETLEFLQRHDLSLGDLKRLWHTYDSKVAERENDDQAVPNANEAEGN